MVRLFTLDFQPLPLTGPPMPSILRAGTAETMLEDAGNPASYGVSLTGKEASCLDGVDDS